MTDNKKLQLLKTKFGYDSFRAQQEGVIDRTLLGYNSLVILPTGGGKSMCYQLPALMLEGVTVVISPLIALMTDQVESLKQNGIEAEALNSQISENEEMFIWESIHNGSLKLIYVSPERALSPSFMHKIQQVNVSQIAIDEAHCVSIWGNDFREDYAMLGRFIACFPNVSVVALTATADSATQGDIVKQLGINDCETFLSSFERKNIEINVRPGKDRIKQIKNFIASRPRKCGIIYCLSRKSCETLAEKLYESGVNARYFHAQLSPNEKYSVQQDFQNDNVDVICATIAFGMGIDKPNIRYVIHYNLPKNIESYYQEIGRAGRDGEPAEALLFASYNDMATLSDFISNSPSANEGFLDVQTQKLSRMWEYTQSYSCRSNFIMSYFGEHNSEGCGHCDICTSPPIQFDGSEIAQKALSAVYRLNQDVGVNMLIDVLRGSNKYDIISNGFNQIKTYGAGQEISWKSWRSYMTQLINQGLLMIDYQDNSKLRLTSLSKAVLKGKSKISLFDEGEIKKESKKKTKAARSISSKVSDEDKSMFESLVELRRKLSSDIGVPAYCIFNNATLEEMCEYKPSSEEEFIQIKGVSENKCGKYGKDFLEAISEFAIAS